MTMAMAAAVVLAGCGQKPEPEAVPARVRIEPVITRATEVDFEDGDRIGLTVTKADGSVYADNALLTYAGGTFSGDLEWYTDGGESCSLKAFYPFDGKGFPESFTVGADQRGGTGVWDLMLATKSGVRPQEAPVTMEFRHQLSQIILSVEGDGAVAIDEVVFKGLLPTELFSFDADGNVVCTPDESAAKIDVIAEPVVAGKRYRAIVVPQTMAFGVSVKARSGSIVVERFTEVTMKPGYSYSVTARVSAEGIAFSLSGDIRAWDDGGPLTPENPPAQDEGYEDAGDHFSYYGKDYATVTLANGSRWMAEPLAYLPAGVIVSDDPASGSVWYPYSSDGTSVTPLKDEESVKAFGYLYSFDVLLGAKVTEDNFDKLEGTRGICPPGWHVPDRNDWLALCGYSNKSAYLGESTSREDHDALFWNDADGYASIPTFNEGGFNFTLGGAMVNNKYQALVVDASVCSVESLYGRNRMTYVASSSPNSSTQFFVAMTTFTSTYDRGRVTLAYAPLGKSGVQLRCVKDK